MYIKIVNNKPEFYSISKLRKDNPNISFPKNITDELLTSYGVYKVAENIPLYDESTQRVESGDIQSIDGVWTQTYNIVDIPVMELQERKIQEVTSIIDSFIQSKINEYNKANGTLFKDINAIPKYLIDSTYTHFPFCEALVKWNIIVWEVARKTQADVLAGVIDEPTDITAILPDLVY